MLPILPSELLRRQVVGRVRAVFHERPDLVAPEPPSDDALFIRDTPIRMVHADVVGMMVGGIRGLFLQMLHPHALQGVLDHSNFRIDMHGRLRRTASFISTTTFGQRDRAMQAIERVNRIHTRVGGTLPGGKVYTATDPRTLAWVHIAEATSFLAAYVRHVRPDMPHSERDDYYRQFAIIARALGADPVPLDQREAETIFRELRADLQTSGAAREVAQFVVNIKPEGAPVALQKALVAEAIAILPPFARSMLELERPGLAGIPARAATWGAGKTLRWAFRQN
jgi:uncharacterized protein (DUF2236 family)